ncbi:MFS general substrate transporter [Penicillium sp. IBT 35674x]|nr:MFS general substrate transporter [Penicillium sp. IBT 35674x]
MAAIVRILSYAVNKPYRTTQIADETPYLNENGYVDFAEGDIENPRNWSMARRTTITMSAVLLVVNATFASSSPSGCFGSISEHFKISTEVAGLTITVFLLGYCAGPLFFAPLSEFYGRRWIFYISFTLYIAFNFLCAFAPNLGALLVGRFLTGTFVSAPLSNCPGLLADLWNPLQRANAMAGFAAMVWIGPALGPVVAGFLELKEDWRWSFYVLLWLGGATAIIMLTIPETYAPIILYTKAKRLREAKIPGYEHVRAAVEDNDRTLIAIYKVALTRPWIILFDPISLLCAIYMAVVYTLLYMLFTIYPIVFQEKRGWNSGVGELPLIGTIVGALLGGGIVLIDTQIRQRRILRGEMKMEDATPEDRLPLAMIGGIGFAIAMFWFAWTAEYNSIHWIVPTIAGCFLSTCMLLLFVAYLNYLVDVYLMYAASAIAANTIARSACGAAAPLFTSQMFAALGVGGGGSLIGGVAALLAVVPFLFYRFGKQIRIKSKFAPTSPARQQKSDVENNPQDQGVQSPTSMSSQDEGINEGETKSKSWIESTC